MKKDKCSYAVKYKAMREPKCGCKLCERKWEIKEALEVLGVPVSFTDMDDDDLDLLLRRIERTVASSSPIWSTEVHLPKATSDRDKPRQREENSFRATTFEDYYNGSGDPYWDRS